MIFISHSHAELEVAKHLEARLLAIGCRSWLDSSQIPIGERFVRAIGAALSQSSVIVFIDSNQSRKSYWCHRERLAGMRLREIGRVRGLIALQPALGEGDLGFSPDFVSASVSDAVDVACDLQRDQNSAISIADVHSVAIEELHPLPEPAVWLGFSDALAALDEWWVSQDNGCWVTGVGGGGKTSLILTWLRALELIGYREALHLGVMTYSFYDQGQTCSSPDQALDRVRSWLRTGNYTSRLVFWDGVERLSERDLSVVLRETKRWNLKFVATSRTNVPSPLADQVRAVHLSSLAARDACILLEKHGMSQGTAQRLTNALDGLPLALAIASAGIKQGAYTAEDVLRMVETAGQPDSRVREDANG